MRTSFYSSSPLERGSATVNSPDPDFMPPMPSATSKNHEIPEQDGAREENPSPPRKRRQTSLEGSTSISGLPVVEPTGGSTDSPAAAEVPVIDSEKNERTSKDYYFDSYSHHAIRKFWNRCYRTHPFVRSFLTNVNWLFYLQMRKCSKMRSELELTKWQ